MTYAVLLETVPTSLGALAFKVDAAAEISLAIEASAATSRHASTGAGRSKRGVLLGRVLTGRIATIVRAGSCDGPAPTAQATQAAAIAAANYDSIAVSQVRLLVTRISCVPS
ncbi:MAG: hypothetical protein IT361_05955 [Gemmatimonadaceae bacterium]|nr:hypothetical protein [Gemmatimonadaceae bacterium]